MYILERTELAKGDRAWFSCIHLGHKGVGPCTVVEVRKNDIYPYKVKLDVTGEELLVYANELSRLASA